MILVSGSFYVENSRLQQGREKYLVKGTLEDVVSSLASALCFNFLTPLGVAPVELSSIRAMSPDLNRFGQFVEIRESRFT